MCAARSFERVAVVGAAGKMGAFFAARLAASGRTVIGLDAPLVPARAAEADLVLLCVPVPAMRQVCLALAPHLRQDAVATDICSVKCAPMADMREALPEHPVVGTHPLFGPAPATDDPLRVAVCESDAPQARRDVVALLRELGLAPFDSTAEEHDRAMAYIQGLNFVTTVAYLATQAGDESIRPFLTPSFKRRLDAARKLVCEDAHLFALLFEANPYSQDAVRSYTRFLNIAAGGDVDLLASRAAWWWDKDR